MAAWNEDRPLVVLLTLQGELGDDGNLHGACERKVAREGMERSRAMSCAAAT